MIDGIVKATIPHSFLDMPAPVFICGGAHAGKSELAHRFLDPQQPAAIIGTSYTDVDQRLNKRIAFLKSQRPTVWETSEDARDLVPLLADLIKQFPQVLLDSLNQFLATELVRRGQQYDAQQIEQQLESEMRALTNTLKNSSHCRIVVVSSEAASGTPPQKASARGFRKILASTNRDLAAFASSVIDVRYGIPLCLKQKDGAQ